MTTMTRDLHPLANAPAPARPLSLVRLFATDDSVASLVARLALAVVIFPHGAQKVLGWFGGFGWSGTMGFFTQGMHIPAPLAALAILAEFLGPIALALGAFSRLAALAIGTNMLVAALAVHTKVGFFMNWMGAQKGEGFEYHLLAMALAAVVIIAGAGRASVDQLIAHKLAKRA